MTTDTEYRHTEAGGFFRARSLQEFMKSRDYNTIPKKVKVTLRFLEDEPHVGTYDYRDGKGNDSKRDAALIMAEIAYEPQASHLIMGKPFPVALSKCALQGLENELQHRGFQGTLKDRTFHVYTKNCKTYVWTFVR
jgi:hypothetical protein